VTTFGAGAAANFLANHELVKPIIAPSNVINDTAMQMMGAIPGDNAARMNQLAGATLNNLSAFKVAELDYKARIAAIEAQQEVLQQGRRGDALRLAGQLFMGAAAPNPTPPDSVNSYERLRGQTANQANRRNAELAPLASAIAGSMNLLGSSARSTGT
tara:strand:+ start:147 stop:620 length:474 start_codon:yes stop_codon:yes gene_type:complete